MAFKKRFFKKPALVLLLCMMALPLSGCRIGNTEFMVQEKKMDENLLFTVDELECPLEEARIYIANYKSLYGTAFGVDLWDGGYDTTNLQDYVKDISLAELERIYTIVGLAGTNEVELTEEESALAKEAAAAYYDSMSEDEKTYTGASQTDVENAYLNYALAMKLYNSMTEGINEEVSDDEARVMQAMQIFVSDSETADMVAAKLENGEDFESVAAGYNEASSIETSMARGEYPQEVEEIAFNLEDGEQSGEIETEEGYYFILCVNKYDEELTEQNKETIRIQKQKAQFDDMYNEYAAGITFHLNQDAWDTVTVSTEEAIGEADFFGVYDSYFGGNE